jgi:hypothetical protein
MESGGTLLSTSDEIRSASRNAINSFKIDERCSQASSGDVYAYCKYTDLFTRHHIHPPGRRLARFIGSNWRRLSAEKAGWGRDQRIFEPRGTNRIASPRISLGRIYSMAAVSRSTGSAPAEDPFLGAAFRKRTSLATTSVDIRFLLCLSTHLQ